MRCYRTETHTEAKARRTLSRFLRKPIEHAQSPGDDDNMNTAARVYGPYKNGAKFRITVIEGTVRKSVCVKTLEEAEQLKADIERSVNDRSAMTCGTALAEFLEDKGRQGNRAQSLITLESKLRLFLPIEDSLASVTPARAQKLYDDETVRVGRFGRVVSVASHRILLRTVKMFFRWTIDRGFLRTNPFERVKPVGKANAGKPQLRLDEARKLRDWLLERAQSSDEGALALLLQLMLGLRSAEVLNRVVRDLDDDGRVLCIPFGKTHNARRRLEIAEELRPLLLRQIEGRAPHLLIFGGERERPYFTDWLTHRLDKACEGAGVPRVCPHSLRGLHSTLALEAGVTSSAVASALGHSSFEITARHYANPDTLRNASVRRVAAALNPAHRLSVGQLIEALRALPPEEQAQVIASVGDRR